jgi:hypothetical protein
MATPGPPQLWHHRIHQRWAGEDLTFWRLAFFPRYNREKVLDVIEKVMTEEDVQSFAIYEALGLFDLFIRAWLPTHLSERLELALNDALGGESLQLLESFSVTRILRHHVWEQGNGAPLDPPESLLQEPPWDDDSITRLNGGNLSEEERGRLYEDRVLAPLRRQDGIKFFTIITSAVFSITNDAKETMREGLLRLLEESDIREPSLYEGSGFGQYIVMGRAEPDDFFAITRLSTAINSLGVREVTARPYTYVCAHRDPLFYSDRIPLRDKERSYDVDALLERDESLTFEVKGSLSHDLKRWLNTDEPEPVSSDAVTDNGVIKAVVGMLNADGGKVVIGALERNDRFDGIRADDHPKLKEFPRRGNYICIGINREYDDKGWDGLRLHLHNLLSSKVQPPPAGNVSVSRDSVEDRDICVIGIQPTRANWYYRVLGDAVNFFVRDGNRTIAYAGVQADAYKRQRPRG